MSWLQGLMKSQVLAGSGLLWGQDHIMAVVRGSSLLPPLTGYAKVLCVTKLAGKLSWKSFR